MNMKVKVKGFTKRVAVLSVLLAIVLFVIFDQRILIPVGILLGSLLAVRKIGTYRKMLDTMGQPARKTSGLMLLLGSLYAALPLLILVVAVIIDKWFFMGVTAGLLTSSTVIIINAITEQIGITHNKWENWF